MFGAYVAGLDAGRQFNTWPLMGTEFYPQGYEWLQPALRNFVEWSGWPFEDALLGLTLNTAQALGMDKKGILEPGADADVVFLDHTFRVTKTFVKGKLVFERPWTN